MGSDSQEDRAEETRPFRLLPPGTVVSRYRVVEKIGVGGMGVVYRAEDTKLKRHVALKFLPSCLTQDPAAKERFIREAQAASALDHPNICTIHEIDEAEDGQMFIAMACYEGDTLREMIKRGPLGLAEAIDIASQIAEGLREAHERDIVHRDVKPANIMVTPRGQAKIMDFGLAKLAGEARLTTVGTTVGTIAYMSPEQAEGKEVDSRSDIWSLGVILYEMLTGMLPFGGEHEQTIIHSILTREPVPIRSVRKDLPADAEQIVARALTKPIDARYQSANDMLADLKRVGERLAREKSKAGRRGAGGAERRPSIAVLPFTNLSADPEQEYFCDGMAEEIINALSHVEELRVVARTSAFAFKGKSEDIRDIGRKLDVESVLEGSVRKAGDRVRISAQLISVDDGYHLWSERFDRRMEDVFAIQDEISLTIVEKLKIKLMAPEKQEIARRHTDNLEAYNLYLRGRYFWNKRTGSELRKAARCFEQAIAKDPTYAPAYSGLADTYTMLGSYDFLPEAEAYPKAKEAALKAVDLDDTLAEAHSSLGEVIFNSGENPEAARQEFKRAIALNPGYATTHHWYSILLMRTGSFEEALAEGNRALDLDPLSIIIKLHVSQLRAIALDWAGAEDLFFRALEIDPANAKVHADYGFFLAVMGRTEEGLAQARQALDLAPDDPRGRVLYGAVLCHARQYDMAIEEVSKVIGRVPYSALPHVTLGFAYSGKDMHDKAIAEFERAGDLSGNDIALRSWAEAFRGAGLARVGKTEEAQKVLDNLLEQSRHARVPPCGLAVLCFALGDLDRGFGYLDRACSEHDPWLIYSGLRWLFNTIGPDPHCAAFLRKMGLEP